MSDAILSFLRDEPISPLPDVEAEDGPEDGPEETDIRSFLSDSQTPEQRESLSREMTHEPTIKTSDYSIRPSVITEGVKKGWADFAALPGYAVDIVNWPLHKIGITPKEPIGGAQQIRTGWELLTDYQPAQPNNAAEAYAGKAAEFVGSGLLISGKAAVVAAELAQMKGTMQALKAGAGAFGLDVLSSAMAGVGAETGGTVVEQGLGQDFRGTGEFLGGMSLGMMPYYIKNLMGGAANVKATIKDPTVQADVMNNAAKQQILNAMGKDAHAELNLERAIELQSKIKGFNPNLAAATNSPGLKAFQESLDAKSIQNLNRSSQSIESSMTAIENYYRTKMPTMDNEIVAKMVGKFKKGKVKLKAGVSKIDIDIERLEKAYDRRPAQKIGERLVTLKEAQLKSVKKLKSEKYQELYQSAKDLKINAEVDDIRILASDIRKADANAFQSMPNVYGKINALFRAEKLDDVSPIILPKPEPKITYASFEKLHSLSREVNREYGKALRSGDSAKEYYLNSIRNVVDEKLAAFDDPVFGNFSKHKKSVDKWWLDYYYNVFKQGLGANIDYKTVRGDMTAPERIVERLVLNKGTKGLEQFNKVYKDLPEAQILLRDGIIDVLAKDVSIKGLKQKTFDSFVSKHKDVLENIPDLRNVFTDSGATIAVLAERRSRAISAAKKYVDFRNSKHAKLAGFDNIQEAIHVGFKDKKTLHTLISSASTKAEKQDLATGMGDYILSNKNPWKFLTENQKTIRPILNGLGDNHYKNVKDVAEAMEIMGRYRLPQTPIRSGAIRDPLQEAIGTSVVSAFAQFRWAFFYGKTSVIYPFVDIGSKYLFKLNQGAVERLIEQSIYDPDLAKMMSTLTKREKIPLKLWSNLSQAALNNGIKATAVAMEQ